MPTKLPTKIVTVSGVHGVGKSALISALTQLIALDTCYDRPKNPFSAPFEAMLFFVSSFSARDRQALSYSSPIILDRWSQLDIGIYVGCLREMGKLSVQQATCVEEACRLSASSQVEPVLSILIDDEPYEILHRISRFREPSEHHIMERDLDFIALLRNRFREEFCGPRFIVADKPMSTLVLEVKGRKPHELAKEVIPRLISDRIVTE